MSRSDADVLADLVVLKAHGTGNDFVVLVDPDDTALDLATDTVVALCDRHRGVGGDGLIRIGGPPPAGSLGDVDTEGAEVTMDYRNGDGSVVEMCGNGIRVTARVAVDAGLAAATDDRVAVGTRSGVREVAVHRGDDDTVTGATVDMGPPSDDPDTIGLRLVAAGEQPPDGAATAGIGTVGAFTLPDVAGHRWTGVSMGNPHAVTTVVDLDAVDLAALGPVVERHAAFRDGTNVNVVEVVDTTHVRLRTWERGIGETLACGSGTCATVAALAADRRVAGGREPVEVAVAGGHLLVRRDGRGHLLLTGPAEVVGRVELDPRWLAAHR